MVPQTASQQTLLAGRPAIRVRDDQITAEALLMRLTSACQDPQAGIHLPAPLARGVGRHNTETELAKILSRRSPAMPALEV